MKENPHERILESDRQDNHCDSYCDCGNIDRKCAGASGWKYWCRD